jgi:hypothetical protein
MSTSSSSSSSGSSSSSSSNSSGSSSSSSSSSGSRILSSSSGGSSSSSSGVSILSMENHHELAKRLVHSPETQRLIEDVGLPALVPAADSELTGLGTTELVECEPFTLPLLHWWDNGPGMAIAPRLGSGGLSPQYARTQEEAAENPDAQFRPKPGDMGAMLGEGPILLPVDWSRLPLFARAGVQGAWRHWFLPPGVFKELGSSWQRWWCAVVNSVPPNYWYMLMQNWQFARLFTREGGHHSDSWWPMWKFRGELLPVHQCLMSREMRRSADPRLQFHFCSCESRYALLRDINAVQYKSVHYFASPADPLPSGLYPDLPVFSAISNLIRRKAAAEAARIDPAEVERRDEEFRAGMLLRRQEAEAVEGERRREAEEQRKEEGRKAREERVRQGQERDAEKRREEQEGKAERKTEKNRRKRERERENRRKRERDEAGGD